MLSNIDNKVSLYILAGVATSENFLDDFKQELERRFKQEVIDVRISILYPYGNWNRGLFRQVMEIGYDVLPRIKVMCRLQRGHQIANYIKDNYQGGRIIIIGHSIGGVVAVQAAKLLDPQQFPDQRVIQIGSPKCAVSEGKRNTTLYIRTSNPLGKPADPITRLGSWGGWERKGRMARWNSRLSAPASIVSVKLIGGHADYFRSKAPFLDHNGKSNLDILTDLIWRFIE